MDAGSNISLGSRAGISALLVNTGAAVTNELGHVQARPSTLIDDYLDSLENTNADFNFESTNKRKTSSYNDQPFIVAP